jgi:hypothetical protein
LEYIVEVLFRLDCFFGDTEPIDFLDRSDASSPVSASLIWANGLGQNAGAARCVKISSDLSHMSGGILSALYPRFAHLEAEVGGDDVERAEIDHIKIVAPMGRANVPRREHGRSRELDRGAGSRRRSGLFCICADGGGGRATPLGRMSVMTVN